MQEIVERDRIIEEKIEQIEQQNKILVEIQITLDEKQKQLADMEQKVEESEQKVTKLTQDLDKSCKVIQVSQECVWSCVFPCLSSSSLVGVAIARDK